MRASVIIACSILASACTEALPYEVTGDAIIKPLTTEVPDPQMGADIFAAREGAHCILCHKHEGVSDEFQGNLGPDLTLVDQRLSEAQIRLRIVDYDVVKPGTTMPSYFRTHDLFEVDSEYNGETVLSDLAIEDIIAFLMNYDGNPENQ